jgi:hypothetical protein
VDPTPTILMIAVDAEPKSAHSDSVLINAYGRYMLLSFETFLTISV